MSTADTESHTHTNNLIHESSPYLLQHAHNPVNWLPWGKEAFDKAKAEDKLLIISIGYSACHWCHVMERESFEDEQVARLMNDNYICVKVDREERPDVDQLYMDAANLMIGRGGWPLNAFAMPDGRPVYAGTYFPKNQWTGLLREISSGYKHKRQQYVDYAEKLMNGIRGLSLVGPPAENVTFNKDQLVDAYISFDQHFDRVNGGKGRAPKFPMPDNYLFLLRYGVLYKKDDALKQSYLTLDKMAKGGIYDQIGGGFARYSTDAIWKVPHFEKMLYDNAQLISLYAEAWQLTKDPLYKKVVYQAIGFVKRELSSPEGGFYSALDADSEGEEGKFYVWTKEEIERVLGEDAKLVCDYYGIDAEGYWEHGNNILLVAGSIGELAMKYSISEKEAREVISRAEDKLLAERSKRVRPGLDNKIILSWNALMLKGLLDAYRIFGEKDFLDMAEKNLSYLRRKMINGRALYHTVKKNGTSIPGFLEDYAFYIQALIQYYQLYFDLAVLEEARTLVEHTLKEFYSEQAGLFYFTSEASNELAARKIDTADNVIASPNSAMAHNLFLLSLYFDEKRYSDVSAKMLAQVMPQLQEYGPFYANWGILLIYQLGPFYEVAICGEQAISMRQALEKVYIPNKLVVGSVSGKEQLPLLESKYVKGKTMLYVCEGKSCLQPTESTEEAIGQMEVK